MLDAIVGSYGYFQKLIGQNHIINKKFSNMSILSSDDEELPSFQSQLCHKNNNERMKTEVGSIDNIKLHYRQD